METNKCKRCGDKTKSTTFTRNKNTKSGIIPIEITISRRYCEECRTHKVKILYECPCDHPKKHNHHFDYDRKYEVIRLCPPCHGKEHSRLRFVGAQEPYGGSYDIKIPYT